MNIKKRSKPILAVMLATSMLTAATAQAIEYKFVMPVSGMELGAEEAPEDPASNEQAATWAELLSQYPEAFSEPDFSEFDLRNEDKITLLPIEDYPNSEPHGVFIINTSVSDISSLNTIRTADEMNLTDNKIQNVDSLALLERLFILRLDSNPNLNDLSGLSDGGGFASPGVRTGALTIHKTGGLYIDKDISTRTGFVGISGPSHLCFEGYSDFFAGGSYATQEEACETTW